MIEELAFALVYAAAGYVGARSTVRTLTTELRELRTWLRGLARHVHYPEPVPAPAEKP